LKGKKSKGQRLL